MANSSSVGYKISTYKAKNWSAKQWFIVFGIVLVSWTTLYVFSHTSAGIKGYEHTKFSSADIRHINSILISDYTDGGRSTSSSPASGYSAFNNNNDGFLDHYEVDTLIQSNYIGEYKQLENAYYNSEQAERKERVRKAITYISSQYGNEISSSQLNNIEQYLSTFSPKETGIFLADYRLSVTSFFWLSGSLVYAEVIFWVIFGVLCSLLFFAGNNIRKSEGNTQKDIVYQLARLFYAPFKGVILVLIYTYLKGGTTLHVEAGEGIIILAFLVGISSGVVLEFWDRVRNNKTIIISPTPTVHANSAHTTSEHNTAEQQNNITEQELLINDTIEQEPRPKDSTDEVDDVTTTARGKKTTAPDREISEVGIDLKLDFSGLYDDERSQLQRLGFSKAIVTLHNVNGRDIVPAKKQSDDMTTFIAVGVKPGIYIARATLSQRLRDDQIINLFGEKTAYITEDKPGLELFVKKYEASA